MKKNEQIFTYGTTSITFRHGIDFVFLRYQGVLHKIPRSTDLAMAAFKGSNELYAYLETHIFPQYDVKKKIEEVIEVKQESVSSSISTPISDISFDIGSEVSMISPIPSDLSTPITSPPLSPQTYNEPEQKGFRNRRPPAITIPLLQFPGILRLRV